MINLLYPINIIMATHNYNQCPEHLSAKYMGIPYVFLDIPRIVPDEHFVDMFHQQARHVRRLEKTAGYPFSAEEAAAKSQTDPWFRNEYTDQGSNWRGFFLTPTLDTTMNHVVINGKKEFPKLFEQLHTYLPINSVNKVRCWENQYPIGLHRDIEEQHSGVPTSLRIMLDDDNLEPTFWLAPKPTDKKGWGYERINPDNGNQGVTDNAIFVDTTGKTGSNTFVFNNYEFCHAAKKNPAHSKILMFMVPEWDWVGFEKLLDQSIEKFAPTRVNF